MIEDNQLNRFSFTRNYKFTLAFAIPMTIIGVFFLGVFTVPLMVSIKNGLKLTSSDIWSATILNILILGLVIYAWVMGYIESAVELTDTYISKKAILTSKTILWSEVISVYMIGPRVTIRSQNKKIQVNVYYYQEPDELVKFIRSHLNDSGNAHRTT